MTKARYLGQAPDGSHVYGYGDPSDVTLRDYYAARIIAARSAARSSAQIAADNDAHIRDIFKYVDAVLRIRDEVAK